MIYFKEGTVIAHTGDAKVYKYDAGFGENLYLEIGPGHNLVSSTEWEGNYREDIYSWSPRGNCLLIGLGLGMSTYWLLESEEVKSLITLETNKEVISVYEKVKDYLYLSDKPNIVLNVDPFFYVERSNSRFDFVYLDFYTIIDEDTLYYTEHLVKALRLILKEEGCIGGFIDNDSPEEMVSEFINILRSVRNNSYYDNYDDKYVEKGLLEGLTFKI